MPRQTAPIAEAIDILKYHNYRHNRRLNATMPSDWKLIYGDKVVDEMERKYQAECNDRVKRIEGWYQEEVYDEPRNV